jgi:hypothetical protein
MTDVQRPQVKILPPPSKHIRIGPDFSHAVRCVAPGRVHPLVDRTSLEIPAPGVTLVNFFPVVTRVEP